MSYFQPLQMYFKLLFQSLLNILNYICRYIFICSNLYASYFLPRTKISSLSTFITQIICSGSVQFSHSVMSNSVTVAHQASLSITNSQSLLKLLSIELVMPCNLFILCCSLLLLPSIFPSIRVFSNESVLHIRWPKYWSFSFSISPSNQYSGLIPLGLTGMNSLQSKGLSRVFFNTTVQNHQFFSIQLSFDPTLISIHDNWKNHNFD